MAKRNAGRGRARVRPQDTNRQLPGDNENDGPVGDDRELAGASDDADVLEGNPLETDPNVGDDDEENTPPNRRRRQTQQDDGRLEIELGGKKLRVTAETAAIVSVLQDSHAAQLKELKKLQKPEPAPDSIDPKPRQATDADEQFFDQFAVKFFEDPKAAARMLRDHITNGMRAEYNEQTGMQRFWNDFYDANADLQRKSDHWIAVAVAKEHYSDIADLPTEQAMKKLGDLVKGRILTLTRRFKRGDDTREAGLDLETGRTIDRQRGTERTQNRDDARNDRAALPSLSQVIRERRAARTNATLRQLVTADAETRE